MIVLWGHEDKGVELRDLGGPGLGVGLAVLTHCRRDRLVEQGQIEVFYVHDFERGVAPLARDVIDPVRDGIRNSARPRASGDDGDFQHDSGSILTRGDLPAVGADKEDGHAAQICRLQVSFDG